MSMQKRIVALFCCFIVIGAQSALGSRTAVSATKNIAKEATPTITRQFFPKRTTNLWGNFLRETPTGGRIPSRRQGHTTSKPSSMPRSQSTTQRIIKQTAGTESSFTKSQDTRTPFQNYEQKIFSEEYPLSTEILEVLKPRGSGPLPEEYMQITPAKESKNKNEDEETEQEIEEKENADQESTVKKAVEVKEQPKRSDFAAQQQAIINRQQQALRRRAGTKTKTAVIPIELPTPVQQELPKEIMAPAPAPSETAPATGKKGPKEVPELKEGPSMQLPTPKITKPIRIQKPTVSAGGAGKASVSGGTMPAIGIERRTYDIEVPIQVQSPSPLVEFTQEPIEAHAIVPITTGRAMQAVSMKQRPKVTLPPGKKGLLTSIAGFISNLLPGKRNDPVLNEIPNYLSIVIEDPISGRTAQSIILSKDEIMNALETSPQQLEEMLLPAALEEQKQLAEEMPLALIKKEEQEENSGKELALIEEKEQEVLPKDTQALVQIEKSKAPQKPQINLRKEDAEQLRKIITGEEDYGKFTITANKKSYTIHLATSQTPPQIFEQEKEFEPLPAPSHAYQAQPAVTSGYQPAAIEWNKQAPAIEWVTQEQTPAPLQQQPQQIALVSEIQPTPQPQGIIQQQTAAIPPQPTIEQFQQPPQMPPTKPVKPIEIQAISIPKTKPEPKPPVIETPRQIPPQPSTGPQAPIASSIDQPFGGPIPVQTAPTLSQPQPSQQPPIGPITSAPAQPATTTPSSSTAPRLPGTTAAATPPPAQAQEDPLDIFAESILQTTLAENEKEAETASAVKAPSLETFEKLISALQGPVAGQAENSTPGEQQVPSAGDQEIGYTGGQAASTPTITPLPPKIQESEIDLETIERLRARETRPAQRTPEKRKTKTPIRPISFEKDEKRKQKDLTPSPQPNATPKTAQKEIEEATPEVKKPEPIAAEETESEKKPEPSRPKRRKRTKNFAPLQVDSEKWQKKEPTLGPLAGEKKVEKQPQKSTQKTNNQPTGTEKTSDISKDMPLDDLSLDFNDLNFDDFNHDFNLDDFLEPDEYWDYYDDYDEQGNLQRKRRRKKKTTLIGEDQQRVKTIEQEKIQAKIKQKEESGPKEEEMNEPQTENEAPTIPFLPYRNFWFKLPRNVRIALTSLIGLFSLLIFLRRKKIIDVIAHLLRRKRR